MFRYASTLLIAGLFTVGIAAAQQSEIDRVDRRGIIEDVHTGERQDGHWIHGDGVGAGNAQRIEEQSEIRSSERISSTDSNSSELADRKGPVPFEDLGHVGDGDTTVDLADKGIDQDRQLKVSGEISGDELVLHLPAGILKDTLSLRSSGGLDLKRAEIQRLGRFEGDDLHLKLSDIGLDSSSDLNNLWVWGTGSESASVLQRVAMSGSISRDLVSDDVPARPGNTLGTSAVGAPIREQRLNEPNMLSTDDQVEKEKQMLRDAGMEKSADDKAQDNF